MSAQSAFIQVSAGPAIGHHGVALLRAGTLVTARDIDTTEGTEDTSTLGALINVFACMPILCELVALPAVALVGAIDVGTFLAARVVLTLIHIFTVLPVEGQLEARGTGAAVGTRGIFTGMLTQAAWIAPTLVYINTGSAESIILIAHLAVTAISPRKIVAHLPLATAVNTCLTLINIHTLGPIFARMVSSSTQKLVPLTSVGPNGVYAIKSRFAWFRKRSAFINIHTIALWIL